MDIGIIGAGAIATYVIETIGAKEKSEMRVRSLYVRNGEKYASLALNHGVTLYTDMDAFLASGIDIVVEAANVAAVQSLLPLILKKKSAVVISIGAFVSDSFTTEMEQLAVEHGHQMYLPSGAIGGLDLIQHTAATETLTSVTLETRKPAHTLIEAHIDTESIVFQGSAAEAIRQFPKNINVAIALGLAGIGMEKTAVKIIADPLAKQNMHTIIAAGAFGKATFQIENAPMPSNANTSYLAAMSVIGTLEKSQDHLRIG